MDQARKEAKTPKPSSSSSSSPPWLDLLEPLTELILERLPLCDYLCFGAVCRKWRSIQKAHRLRHFPSPPPMAPSFPWLFVTDKGLFLTDKGSLQTPISYSPFDQTLHRLRVPSTLSSHAFVGSSHGWLILLQRETWRSTPSLLNPITGHRILLPPINANFDYYIRGAISAPPSDPHYTILIAFDSNIFFRRRASKHKKWIRLDLPEPEGEPGSFCHYVIHGAGKFYCIACPELYVIDPRLDVPSVQLIEMDDSQAHPYVINSDYSFLELNGEILALMEDLGTKGTNGRIEDFHLFRADLSANVWVRMENGIGDRVLFFAWKSSFSLLATDLGCNKNCIYFTWEVFSYDGGDHGRKMVAIFDLGTKSIISEHPVPDSTIKEAFMQFDHCNREWFMPRLDFDRCNLEWFVPRLG